MILAEEVRRLSGRACEFLPSARRLDRSRARTVPHGTGFRFLFIGRYAAVKGVDVLLDAMSEYVRRGHDGQLFLFGGGPLEAFVRRRASAPDLRERVTIGGFADEETVVTWLQACDCLVIPSRLESIPVVLSDALQMRRPVIVSDVGDMGSVVRDGAAGLVVAPESPMALADAMVEMSATGRGPYARGLDELAAQFDIAAIAARWLDDVAESTTQSLDRSGTGRLAAESSSRGSR